MKLKSILKLVEYRGEVENKYSNVINDWEDKQDNLGISILYQKDNLYMKYNRKLAQSIQKSNQNKINISK